MARFVMNAMLASGGYPWTVIRVEDRDAYLAVLESESTDGFNNREIATAIWTIVIVAVVARNAKVRESFYGVLKALCQKLILIPLGMMVAYISLLVYGLHAAGLWETGQIKNTIVWSIAVAAVSLFRIGHIAEGQDYFKNAIKDNLKIVVLIEFFVGSYTFDLWAELLIVPFSAVIAGMLVVAQSDPKYQTVEKLLNVLLIIFGGGLIAYAFYNLATDFGSFAKMETLADFMLPPVLSLLFLPFVYIMSLYVNYENAFLKLNYAIMDPSLNFYAKRRAIVAFHLRTTLLKRWARNVIVSRPGDRQAVDDAIDQVKKVSERERNPEDVPLESGWSPFAATEFLAAEGLATGDYHRGVGDDDEWWASSPYLEIGDAIMPNNLAYYVDGDEAVATALKLVLNVNVPKSALEARRKLLTAARVLYEKALAEQMPDEIAEHVEAGDEFETRSHRKRVAVLREPWPGHRSGGHAIKFIIQNPQSS